MIELFKEYECRVVPRESYKSRPLKESINDFRGQTVNLRAGWIMDEDEKYPNEYAMLTVPDIDFFFRTKIPWIASGDVEIIKEINRSIKPSIDT